MFSRVAQWNFTPTLPRIRTCPLGHTDRHIMNSLRDGSLSESAIRLVPDTAIRCCFVGTVKGFDAPAMFPSNGVMTWRPLLSTGSLGMVPPLQRYYGTLRLPAVRLDPFDSSRADTIVSPVVCSPRSWASHRGPGSCRFRSPIRIDDGNVGVSAESRFSWIVQLTKTITNVPFAYPAHAEIERQHQLR